MSLKIYRHTLAYIGLFVFLFFVFMLDFRTSLFHNVYLAYVWALSGIIFIWYGCNVKVSKVMSNVVMIWFITILFIIFTFNLSYIIKYIFSLILLYCFYKTGGTKDQTVKVLAFFGIIFTLATFLFYIYPQIYNESIVPKLEEYLRVTALNMMRTKRYPGLTGHYSTNGTYLAIGFGAIFSLIVSKNYKKNNYILLIFLILTLGALLMIGKRAHLVFAFVSSIWVYWLYSKNKHTRFLNIVAIISVLIILFFVFAEQFPVLKNTFDRFYETAKEGTFLMSRDIFYKAAFKKFIDNPLFGSGWRTAVDYLEHDVHNIYIQLLAETGIIGFSIFVGLIVYGVVIGIKVLLKLSKVEMKSSLVVFSVYYIFFFTLYGFTGNPLYDEQPFYIYMICYGSLIYYKNKMLVQNRRKANDLYINFS